MGRLSKNTINFGSGEPGIDRSTQE